MPGTFNTIGGNGAYGIEISGTGTNKNIVQNDGIGIGTTGTAIGNGNDGVIISGGASMNEIGEVGAGLDNIISNNGVNGVEINGATTFGNVVRNSYMGVGGLGTGIAANTANGVLINNAPDTLIGGGAGAANIISGNGSNGVLITGNSAEDNTVVGNVIGLDSTGALAGNTAEGVWVSGGASGNNIGASGMGNTIAGNHGDGLQIAGAGSILNNVLGNYIGTDAAGHAGLANSLDGVYINGAPYNDIGAAGAGNVISGNGADGVHILGAAATGNNILGNWIGTNPAGKGGLPNTDDGVSVQNAPGNIIGSSLPGEGNVISGNGMNGVHLLGAGATGNYVHGNMIGTDSTGAAAVANGLNGVFIDSGSSNIIGGLGAGNTIAFNGKNGVDVVVGTGNLISRNSIFMNTKLGIDLGDNGVTMNHVGVATGANDLQNFPSITSAMTTATGTNVTMTLNSTPNHTFILELYSNAVGNASGYGEGKTFIASPLVTTNANGDASFTLMGLQGIAAGSILSATATDITAGSATLNDTSEFGPMKASADLVPPTVDNLTFVMTKNKVTGVQISFNEGLKASTVTSSAFQLFGANSHGAYTTPIALAAQNPIQYNATTDVVTLAMAKPLAAGKFIEVFVNGTNHAVTDLAGTALDGEFTLGLPSGNGIAGGDFAALVAYGPHISYVDAETNKVSLTLSRGGTMEVIRTVNGEGRYIELANVIAGRTILAGSVAKGRTGTGTTTIQGITGLGGATDKLPPSEFTVVNSMLGTLDALAPWAAGDMA